MWEGLLESLSHQSGFENSTKTKTKLKRILKNGFEISLKSFLITRGCSGIQKQAHSSPFRLVVELSFPATAVVIQPFGSMRCVEEFAGLGFMLVFPAGNA